MITTAIIAGKDGDTEFSKMYNHIESRKDDIFNTICQDVIRIQGCNSTEKEDIFDNNVPSGFWFTTAGLLEIYGDCSGLDPEVPLPKFYFTNYQKYFSELKSKGKHRRFLVEICLLILLMVFL